MTEPTSEEVKEALVKTGVTEDQVKWMLDMERMKNEELLPTLQDYVEEGDWGPMLRHPLVYSIPLMLPGQANMAFLQKKAALDEAILKEDWATVVWLHERPYRLWALCEHIVGWDDEADGVEIPVSLLGLPQDKRDLAADVWADSENISQNIEEWTALFAGWECGFEMLFSDDPEGWAELNSPLTVYRAGIDDGGWSWTLDPEVAAFFAKRFGANHVMSVGKVRKECVFGYLTRRSEAEVLVPDGTVYDVRPFAGVVK